MNTAHPLPLCFNRLVAAAAVFALASSAAHAQLRVAQWNVTNYSSGRAAEFRSAIYDSFAGRSMNPDVIIAQEIVSAAGAVNFRNLLNTYPGGPTDWQFATFIDFPADTDNALFYRSSKLTFIDVVTLDAGTGSGAGQPPRPNERYRVRLAGFNAPSTELYLYAAHMKAGDTTADRNRRTPEAQRLRNDTQTLPAGSHFILGGDFNTQSWTEPAYQLMVQPGSFPAGRFIDPIKSPGAVTTPGSWNGNNAYRFIHTQDPATCDAACGAGCNGGGMDDRHDQILISSLLADGNALDYIGNVNLTYSTSTWNDPNHSYRAWGNDGSSFNCRLNTTSNAMVGNTIAQALVASASGQGHLPIMLDLQVPAKIAANSFVDFGTVTVGDIATRTLNVSNATSVPLWSRAGNGTGIDDLDYTLTASSGFTAPAGAFSAQAGLVGNLHTLTMSTATPGLRVGTVTITSDDPDQPTRVITLVGTVEEPVCPCDWDQNGELGSQDFFDFIADFFAGSADFNNSGDTTSQDFFDFLTCFLGGC